MNQNDFKNFLEDRSWDYDKKIIEQMMEEELKKAPEEINMEFVDTCMNYLTGYSDNIHSEKNKVIDDKKQAHMRIKFSRLLMVAIIVILSASLAITVYANVNDVKILDMFVNLFSDHVTIDYSKKDSSELNDNISYVSSKLYKDLQDSGIENIALPIDLYSAKYDKLNSYNDFTEYNVYFTAELDNKKFLIDIETFTDKKWIQNPDIQGQFTAKKKIDINGIDVYLFERKGDNPKEVTTSISYQIGLTQYFIDCHYSIDEAELFVKNMN